MVKSVGWWKTFGRLILLMVAIWIVGLIIALITAGLNKASESAGSIIGGLLMIVFKVIVAAVAVRLLHLGHVPRLRVTGAGRGGRLRRRPAGSAGRRHVRGAACAAGAAGRAGHARRGRRTAGPGDAHGGHHAERPGHTAGDAAGDAGRCSGRPRRR